MDHSRDSVFGLNGSMEGFCGGVNEGSLYIVYYVFMHPAMKLLGHMILSHSMWYPFSVIQPSVMV